MQLLDITHSKITIIDKSKSVIQSLHAFYFSKCAYLIKSSRFILDAAKSIAGCSLLSLPNNEFEEECDSRTGNLIQFSFDFDLVGVFGEDGILVGDTGW